MGVMTDSEMNLFRVFESKVSTDGSDGYWMPDQSRRNGSNVVKASRFQKGRNQPEARNSNENLFISNQTSPKITNFDYGFESELNDPSMSAGNAEEMGSLGSGNTHIRRGSSNQKRKINLSNTRRTPSVRDEDEEGATLRISNNEVSDKGVMAMMVSLEVLDFSYFILASCLALILSFPVFYSLSSESRDLDLRVDHSIHIISTLKPS
jgi:hypothetical protein